jgi:hypothetical protein
MESARAAEFFCGPALETTTTISAKTLSINRWRSAPTTTKAFFVLAKKRGS